MAGQGIHMIGNLVFDVDIDDERSFAFLSSRFRKLAGDPLLQAIDAVFANLAAEDPTIRIPRLEVDLGQLHPDHFEEVFIQQFSHALIRELEKLLNLPEGLNQQSGVVQTITEADRLLQLVTHFIRHGHRPWWASREVPHLDRAFQEIIRVRRPPTRSMVLEEGQSAESRKRIIYAFSDPTIFSLFAILTPEPESFFREYVEEFQIVHRAEAVVREEDRKFRKVIQELILMYLIDLKASGIDQVGFLEFQMRRLSRRYRIPFPVLVRRFRDAVSRLSGGLLPQKGVLLPIAEALYLQVFPEDANRITHQVTQERLVVEAAAVRHLKDLFQRGNTSLPVKQRVHQDKDRFLRWMIAEREPVFKDILYDLGRDALVRRRILNIFKEESVRQLFESLAPGKLELIYAAFELFEVVRTDTSPPKQERKAFRKSVQAIALQLLIEEQGHRMSDARYIDALLTKFARQYRIQSRRLLHLLIAELENRLTLSAGMQVLRKTLLALDLVAYDGSHGQTNSGLVGLYGEDKMRTAKLGKTSRFTGQTGALAQLLLRALTTASTENNLLAELISRLLLLLRSDGAVWGQLPTLPFIRSLVSTELPALRGLNRLADALTVLADLLRIDSRRMANQFKETLEAPLHRVAPDVSVVFKDFLQQLNSKKRANFETITRWLELLKASPDDAAIILLRHPLPKNLPLSHSQRILHLLTPQRAEQFSLVTEKLADIAFPAEKRYHAREILSRSVIEFVLKNANGADKTNLLVLDLLEKIQKRSGINSMNRLQKRLAADQSDTGVLLQKIIKSKRQFRKSGITPPKRGEASQRQLTLSYLLELWGEDIWSEWVPDSEGLPPEEIFTALLETAPEALREFLLKNRFSEILPGLLAESLSEELWVTLLPVANPEYHAEIRAVERTFLYWYATYRMVRMPASIYKTFVRQHLLEYVIRTGRLPFDPRSATVHIYDTLYRYGKLDLQELARLPEAVFLTDRKLQPREVWSSFLLSSPALPLSQQRRSTQFFHDLIFAFLEQGSIPPWASELDLSPELIADIFSRLLNDGSPLLAIRFRELRMNEAVIRRLRQLVDYDDYRVMLNLIEKHSGEQGLLGIYDRLVARVATRRPGAGKSEIGRTLAEVFLTEQLWLLGQRVLESDVFAALLLSKAFPGVQLETLEQSSSVVSGLLQSGDKTLGVGPPGSHEFEVLSGFVRIFLRNNAWPTMLTSGDIATLTEILGVLARQRPDDLLVLLRKIGVNAGNVKVIFKLLPPKILSSWADTMMQALLPGKLTAVLQSLSSELSSADRRSLELLILADLIIPDRLTGLSFSRFFNHLSRDIAGVGRILEQLDKRKQILESDPDLPWIAPARLLMDHDEFAHSEYLLPENLSSDWDLVRYYLQYGSVNPVLHQVDKKRIAAAIEALGDKAYHFLRRQVYSLARHAFSRKLLVALFQSRAGIDKALTLIHPNLPEKLRVIQKLTARTYTDYPFFAVLGLDDPSVLADYMLRLWTSMPFLVMTPSSIIRLLLLEYSKVTGIPLRIMLSEMEQQAEWPERSALKGASDGHFQSPQKAGPEISTEDEERNIQNQKSEKRHDGDFSKGDGSQSPAVNSEKADRTVTKSDGRSLGDPQAQEDARPLIREVREIENAAEAAKAVKEKTKPDQSEDNPPAPEDGIYVPNAGLCLLWPFLGRLFRRLNMMEGKDFIDEETRSRAILLTEYLVTGRTSVDVSNLTLNKVFCGAEPHYTVDRDVLEVTPEEDALVESLLKGAIYNWEKVRGTRVETFRETFLQRDGVLRKEGKNWVLTVETRAYDLLLMTLPWNLGIIKTAWMTAPLEVVWEHGGTKL